LPVAGVLTEVVWPAAATAPPSPQRAAPQPLYEVRPRTSDRSRLVAGLLGLLLPLVGINGAHRLYTGHIGLGILMLITCGGCGIWQLIDTILVFAGSVRDVDGLPLAP
jgi:TM2 domain-containing membrane protein YozV